MGNINRRSSLRAAQQQHANEWGEASVGKMISENKLAPIVSPEGEAQNEECPICFLDFSSINTVICCKQQICTGCVVQLHTATAKASCPFCSNQELKVTYTKKERVPIALSASPDKDAGDCDFSDQASSRSSTSSVNLSYTTPEQERKIRSLSYDNNSNLLSRSDREALEAQIRDQRRQSEEEECVAAARGSPSLSLRESYLRAQSASLAQRRRTGGMAGGTRNQSYRLGGTATGSGSPGLADDNRNGRVGENRFLDSLHGLLTSQDRVTSIQQLEDIMLMEAIRLSMQDVPPTDEESEPATTEETGATVTADGGSGEASAGTESPGPLPVDMSEREEAKETDPVPVGSIREGLEEEGEGEEEGEEEREDREEEEAYLAYCEDEQMRIALQLSLAPPPPPANLPPANPPANPADPSATASEDAPAPTSPSPEED